MVDDSFQPVVVSGAAIEAFAGTSVNEIFAYAYQGGTWTQIPYQIDEKAANDDGKRVYTTAGDGRLDADEELVFMLRDMGKQAPTSAWVDEANEDYRIELMADSGDGNQRWAYLFRGPELSQTFSRDYVRFSGPAQRVIAEQYQIGFLDDGFGLSELRLNNSGIDLLDRTKIRLQIVVGFIFRRTCTEDDLCGIETEPIVPLKDGPIRLVWHENGGFAYDSLFQTPQEEVDLSDSQIPGTSIENFRFSMDFNEQVVATTTPTLYLDANMSEPAVIDGQADAVPTEPVPAWRQISHNTGTIIVTTDLSGLGGTQHNYYKDDETFDSQDTGDGRSYGDVGFSVVNPNTSFTLATSLLILPPTQENVGATYAERLTTPPVVTAGVQIPAGPLDRKAYLPFVRR